MVICSNCKKDMTNFVCCPYCNYGRKEDPKLEHNPKPITISFSISKEEHDQLKKASEKMGLSRANYIKLMVLRKINSGKEI